MIYVLKSSLIQFSVCIQNIDLQAVNIV